MKYTPMQIQRLKKGLSQETVSKTFGISRSYLSQIETYEVTPPNEVLNMMIKLYGCGMKDLFPLSG